jgi:hypothetical protein
MPKQPGKYTYRLRFEQAAVQQETAGSFTAVIGKIPGIVRVDPAYPSHFLREGTQAHWFWNSTTTYQILAFDDETIERSLKRLASLGINRIRLAICGRTKDGSRWNEPLVVKSEKFAFKMEPWVARQPDSQDAPQFDVDRFNIPFYDKIDRTMRLARELDIVVSIIFYVDGADQGVDPFGKQSAGGPAEQRYYRYTVARLAAYPNLMWDVTNEWHLFRTEEWVNRMGSLIRQADPYGHMISCHGKGVFPFRTADWADYAMYQSWDEHGGYAFMLRNRREQESTGKPKPQVNEEYGYEDHYPFPWGQARLWPARTSDTRRRLAWEISMAGCYQTTGERANDGTGAGLDTGGGWVNGRGNDQMTMLVGYRHMKKFFENMEWWRLQPASDVIEESKRSVAKGPASDGKPPAIPVLKPDPMCLMEVGKRYVVYLPQGGSVRLKLEPGKYTLRWFDPRNGTTSGNKPIEVTSVWDSPPAPSAEDWVLVLD